MTTQNHDIFIKLDRPVMKLDQDYLDVEEWFLQVFSSIPLTFQNDDNCFSL